MALLQVDRGDRQGEIITLAKDRIVLGREKDCDVLVSLEDVVSRRHAQITRTGGRWFLEDLKSRNGTKLNSVLIPARTPMPLKHKDVICICDDFQATFLDMSPEEAASASSSVVEATLSSDSQHSLVTQPAAKLAALLEITAKLSNTLNLDAQLPEVADGILRIFPQADRCFLILFEEETGKLIPKVVRTRRLFDESKEGFSRTIVYQCLKSSQALLLKEADALGANSESYNAFNIRSVMCVPLRRSDGSPFGVLQVDTQDARKKFTEDDLKLLWGVAHQASVALENARMHSLVIAQERVRSELELASQVQRSFLPADVPQVPGYEFYAYYEAAREVGGDYYDFISLPDDRLAVTLGDVAGKGMPAALLMARLSSDTRSALLSDRSPTDAIARLNDRLFPATSPVDRFVTMIAAILDPRSHALTLINAGHPPALLLRRADRTLIPAVPVADEGQSLGLALGNQYQSFQIDLRPGDFVLLYTDGVTDAVPVSGKRFGLKGIHSVLDKGVPTSPKLFGQRLVDSVQRHAGGVEQYDDITLVCFGRQAK